MKLWRVSPARSLEQASRAHGAGRWSWASRDVLYTSSTPELAVLEALAHRTEKPVAHWLCLVELPGVGSGPRLDDLPGDWRVQQALTRRLGNAWYDDLRSPVLLVPSAVCEEATNVLVNPRHPRARSLRMTVLRRFDFDRRLTRGS